MCHILIDLLESVPVYCHSPRLELSMLVGRQSQNCPAECDLPWDRCHLCMWGLTETEAQGAVLVLTGCLSSRWIGWKW